MKHTMSTLSLAFLGLAAGNASAGYVRSIDCNIDIYNLTGQTANDFDIKIGGVAASQVTDHYTGQLNPFPDYAVTTQTDGTVLVRFSGAQVAHGDSVHIGYEISPLGPPGTIDQYWSLDGAKLGGPSVYCGLPLDYRAGTVTNSGTSDVYVSRRVAYQSDMVLLNDLLTTGSLWSTATLLDTSSMLLGGGQSIDYMFADMGHGAYVMMTEVCEDAACARRLETVFSAVNYTPEPGALSLLAAGVVATVAMRRRKC